ncbi:MAG TPA: uracil/xanthine transporter, partial [Bacillaceae bacterium]
MQTLSRSTLWAAGFQWLFFIFANTVVIPLSIGAAFHLPADAVAATMRSSFIITGAASILQGVWGHRFPLMEGHSGIWWGLILSLAGSAAAVGTSYTELGGSIAAGILLSGMLTIILGVTGFIHILKKVFNHIVMSVYLLLLSCQLIIIFFKGMLGLSDGHQIDFPLAALSISLVALVILLNVKGKGKASNFSLLIGILIGWLAYGLFFPAEAQTSTAGNAMFSILPWGSLRFDIGIVITAFLTGLINMANSIVAISTAEKLYQAKTTDKEYKQSFVITGLQSVASTFLGLVPSGPYTSSIGFLESTRIYQRPPFLIGGALMIILGLVPILGTFFSMLPVSVGNAVLFVAYLQLFGTSLRNIQAINLNSKTLYRLAVPALAGICIMNIPAGAFAPFPMLIRPLISNGLLVGVMLSLLFEIFGNW